MIKHRGGGHGEATELVEQRRIEPGVLMINKQFAGPQVAEPDGRVPTSGDEEQLGGKADGEQPADQLSGPAGRLADSNQAGPHPAEHALASVPDHVGSVEDLGHVIMNRAQLPVDVDDDRALGAKARGQVVDPSDRVGVCEFAAINEVDIEPYPVMHQLADLGRCWTIDHHDDVKIRFRR